MRRTYLWTGAIAALLGIAGILTANATEPGSATASLDRSFTATTIELRNLHANLHIENHDGETVKLHATGPADDIARLMTTTMGTSLIVEAPMRTRTTGVSNVVHVENNVVINRGGTSTVIIGGIPSTAEADRDQTSRPIDIRLAVPNTAALSILGFAGTAEIADRQGPVELELLSGAASFERLGAASLSIAGGARIEISRAEAPLDLTIDGSGDILVHDADIPALTLETNGTATLVLNGRVVQAEMSLNGIADIRIAHVETEPFVEANGIVTIDIGNWR